MTRLRGLMFVAESSRDLSVNSDGRTISQTGLELTAGLELPY